MKERLLIFFNIPSLLELNRNQKKKGTFLKINLSTNTFLVNIFALIHYEVKDRNRNEQMDCGSKCMGINEYP